MTFRGSPQNPTKEVVELTTAPTAGTATHWGQQSDTQSTWRPGLFPDVRVISMFGSWERAVAWIWENTGFQ